MPPTITIPLQTCGCLPGDACDCAQQAHDARAALMPGLVDRARAGDRDAFGHVYAHYRDRVLRFVVSRLPRGSFQLAEDLTSETFERALRRVDRFAWQDRDFGAWLTTIARNLVADHYKSSHHRRSTPVNMADHADYNPDLDRHHDPVRVAEHNAAAAVLDAVIRLLTIDQRRVLALRFGEGLSVAETAAVMRLNAGAVKALQYRACRALAHHLTERAA